MHRAIESTKGAAVANHNPNGGRDTAQPDDQRASWRPQDQSPQPTSYRQRDEDDRSWRDRSYRDDDRRAGDRDPRRWEGGRGSELGNHDERDSWRATERYGQGQSGYSAGRHGEDRSQRVQNRNDMVPSAGSFEDRHHDLGVDDRFTGRGRSGYWQDRSGYDPEHYTRGHEAARSYETARGYGRDERTGYQTGSNPSLPQGYSSGSYGQGYGGYGGYGPRQQATQDDAQRGSQVHRGPGPHRGRGPAGYHRSDERIREAVCESLTEDDQIDASHIEVSVRNGEVMLSGVVEDRRSKRNAEDCVYAVSGVRDVQNLLRVKDDDRAHKSNLSSQGSAGDIETLQSDRKHRA